MNLWLNQFWNWVRLLCFGRGRRHHRYNIGRSRELLKKFATFEHDGALINYLKKMDPYLFEELVLSAFEQHGVPVKRSLSYSGDGGYDGMVKWFDLGWIHIQSKCYTHYIKKEHVLAFEKLCQRRRMGFFVHTASSGGPVLDLAASSPICLVSGSVLCQLIRGQSLEAWKKEVQSRRDYRNRMAQEKVIQKSIKVVKRVVKKTVSKPKP